ncbi:hypothetical protein AVEN_66592-1 [Araneus ventricosus]|uniref:Uncharacterized protein n=1 Tax=Araneus ventricosus TaxID=182803 RepID=A0A4Y2SI22_ARAVE|nr:hypothetical protein AVEN_66592-1 [Araneus ventricosus]
MVSSCSSLSETEARKQVTPCHGFLQTGTERSNPIFVGRECYWNRYLQSNVHEIACTNSVFRRCNNFDHGYASTADITRRIRLLRLIVSVKIIAPSENCTYIQSHTLSIVSIDSTNTLCRRKFITARCACLEEFVARRHLFPQSVSLSDEQLDTRCLQTNTARSAREMSKFYHLEYHRRNHRPTFIGARLIVLK